MSTDTVRIQLQNLTARLQAGRQALQIYPPRHPQLEEAFEECFAELRRMLGSAPSIQIAAADDEFVVGNVQVPAEGELLKEFAETLRSLSISKLIFSGGIRRWELQRFLQILAAKPTAIAAAGGVARALADAGVVNIEAGTISLHKGGLPGPEVLFRTWEAYSTGVKTMRAIKESARKVGSFKNAEEAREFAYRLTELAIKETRPLLAVHSLMKHDEYSFTHSVNVAMLTLAMARNLPLDQDDLHEIAVAALLHDVGKECIPLEILQKPGALNDEEWKVVNRHGLEGARMLCHAEGVGDLAPIVAYEHHLAYHEELRDETTWEPHLASQIVCLADVYDALRSIRPYRGEVPPDEAMTIMEKDAGKKFDPVLFEGFYRMVGFYPPGTVVELASGSLAVVFAGNADHPHKPQVVVVRDVHGEPLTEPHALDLADSADGDEITRVADPEAVGVEPANYL